MTDRAAPIAPTSESVFADAADGLVEAPTEVLRALVEAAPDGMLLCDAEGQVRYANRRMEALTGYDREDLLGRPVDMLVPLPSREKHLDLRRGYRDTPHVRMMGEGRLLELRRRDGSHLPVEIGLSPVEVGGTMLVAASVRDVSDQRSADRARRRLLDLLDLVPDAVIMVDSRTNRIDYANHGAAMLLGHEHRQLIGLDAAELHPDLAGHRPDRAGVREIAVRDAAGREIPCEVHVRYVAGDDGVPHAIQVLRDVREQKAQQELLLRSEESFRTAFEQSPIGMAVSYVSVDGNRREIVRANAAMADILGVPVDELPGRTFTEFTDPAEEQRDAGLAAKLGRRESGTLSGRKRYRRPDGSSVWVEYRAAQVDFPDVDGVTMLVHLVDISARHALEQQRARQDALGRLVAELATKLLAGARPEATYSDLAVAAAEIAGATNGGVILATPDGSPVRVAVHGEQAETLGAEDVPFVRSMMSRALAAGHAVAVPQPPPDAAARLRELIGPMMTAPFTVQEGQQGILVVGRRPGERPFIEDDVELLNTLAAQVGLVIELARARTDQQRLAVMEDRQRIARDLHDTVIQDLIAVGMQLNMGLSHQPADRAERDSGLIDQVEEIVRQLRGAVFQLRERPRWTSLSEATAAISAEAARVLGHAPELSIAGTVDELPAAVCDEVLAVLREALSNVARHASANQTWICLEASHDLVRLTVEDDGCGIPSDATPGNGLANLEHRAAALGGDMEVADRSDGGTRFSWTCSPTLHLT